MFLRDDVGVYGFEYFGKHFLDELRTLLFRPELALFGSEVFELGTLPPGACVTLRRAREAHDASLPWCHFWGDCSTVGDVIPCPREKEWEEISFTAKPFQLVKHFVHCCCDHLPRAQVLVCLEFDLMNDLRAAVLARKHVQRRFALELFYQELVLRFLNSICVAECITKRTPLPGSELQRVERRS